MASNNMERHPFNQSIRTSLNSSAGSSRFNPISIPSPDSDDQNQTSISTIPVHQEMGIQVSETSPMVDVTNAMNNLNIHAVPNHSLDHGNYHMNVFSIPAFPLQTTETTMYETPHMVGATNAMIGSSVQGVPNSSMDHDNYHMNSSPTPAFPLQIDEMPTSENFPLVNDNVPFDDYDFNLMFNDYHPGVTPNSTFKDFQGVSSMPLDNHPYQGSSFPTLAMETTDFASNTNIEFRVEVLNPLMDFCTDALNVSNNQVVSSMLLVQDSHQGSSSHTNILPQSTTEVPMPEKSDMVDVAIKAMDELIKLFKTNKPLWKESTIDGRDTLDVETYCGLFSKKDDLKNPKARIEASRTSGMVMMNGLELADIYMNPAKWMQYFPTIVADAKIVKLIESSAEGNPSGTMQLMSHALQVLSPMVPIREISFLRYCLEIDQGSWAIVDVSVNQYKEKEPVYSMVRKLPSGCLIQDMPNGCTKVRWIEHVEVEDKDEVHPKFKDLVEDGIAFGAGRWISTLQRISERFEFLPGTNSSIRDLLGGVVLSLQGRQNILKLSQMMINTFFAGINTSHKQRWSTLKRSDNIAIRVAANDCTETEPRDMIICVSTTILLPQQPRDVFNFLRNERVRPRWDALAVNHSIEGISHIVNGSDSGNRVSLFKSVDSKGNAILILQESSTDASGSIVVHSPIDIDVLGNIETREDNSGIVLLPTGFSVIPVRRSVTDEASCSNRPGQSLVTLGFQIYLRDLPGERLDLETFDRVEDLINENVEQLTIYLTHS